MSFWQKILERLGVEDPFDRSMPVGSPADPVGFSIGLLALCAKMAKADGRITRDEVICVRSIIHIAPRDEQAAARVFNLCGRDASGHLSYARKVDRAIGQGDGTSELRVDVLDALYHVAMADGEFHPAEKAMLDDIAEIFGITAGCVRQIEARHLPEAWDPHTVLGVAPGADADALKSAWRRHVKNEHPDVVQARGLPADMIRLAEMRLVEINRAYEELRPRIEPSLS